MPNKHDDAVPAPSDSAPSEQTQHCNEQPVTTNDAPWVQTPTVQTTSNLNLERQQDSFVDNQAGEIRREQQSTAGGMDELSGLVGAVSLTVSQMNDQEMLTVARLVLAKLKRRGIHDLLDLEPASRMETADS